MLVVVLIEQCHEERLLEQGDADHMSLVILANIDNHMPLWHIS